MYDYLRKRVLAGPGQHQLLLKGVNPDNWIALDEVPDELLRNHLSPPSVEAGMGGMKISLGMISGLPGGDPSLGADLDSFVESEEIVDVRPGSAQG
jgi:hypothetical protein